MTDLTFEEALARFEQIVQTLEAGNLPLDDTLRIYEEAVGLARFCAKYLKDAQQRIELLTRDESGLLKAEPFGWEGEEAGK